MDNLVELYEPNEHKICHYAVVEKIVGLHQDVFLRVIKNRSKYILV